MKKISKLLYLYIILPGFAIILTLSTPAVLAQNWTLPKIPIEWPVHLQNSLTPRRDALDKRLKAYDKKIIDFNGRCGNISLTNLPLMSACSQESQALDKEFDEIDKEKESFLKIFKDNTDIYNADTAQKGYAKRLNEKIYPQGKPVGKFLDSKGESGAFGENIVKNPNLNDNNTDIGTYWGGRTGNAPGLPDLKYGNKNSIPDNAIEQRLAKKYPAFNEILKKENQLKSEEVKLKKDGVTLYQEIKGKGPTATQDDWNKLKKITNNLEKVNEDLKKATEQKEKIKKDYTVADTFQ